jgi:type II secretory pathway component GspD/PulD (secretin)
VGGTVPQRTVVSTNTAALVNVAQIPFGVELQVRPIVGEDGTLTLDVVPSISSLGPLSPAGDPSFVDTTLRTSVRLRHGEGIVLGGLIQEEEREATDQVPFLGDVPLLGALFGRKVKDRRDREVALVLLPRVVVPKPEGRFALEVPPPDFRVRAGVFLDPELGARSNMPPFDALNAGEGRPR